jgi:hypothetical protein
VKRWKAVVAPAIVAAAGVVFSCTSLPDIAPTVCGNHVVDRDTEDCDESATAGPDATTAGKRRCGAPGTTSQCRILCTTGADCEAGWGCGLDGICRQPRGTYAASAPIAEEADDLALADFDGDGVSDILTWKSPPNPFEGAGAAAPAPARMSIHYGEASGDVKQDFQVHIANALNFLGLHPSAAHLTADTARADVVVSVRGGTSIFHGQADRTLLPILNPSFAVPNLGLRPVIVDATTQSPGDEIFLFAQTDIGNPAIASISPLDPKTGQPDPTKRLALFTSPKKLATIYAGHLHTSGGPGCGEIAVAFEGDNRVAIVTPCTPTGEINLCDYKAGDTTCKLAVPVHYINLPVGQSVTPTGLNFGDYDGDGDLDVIIATGELLSNGRYLEPGACIALGTPDSKFKGVLDAPALSGRCVRLDAFFPVATGGDNPALLAFGQLTNDTAVDFVTERTIVLHSGASSPGDAGADGGPTPPDLGPATIVLAPPGTDWTEAHIVDINGDGRNDVVAGGPGGVDVYTSTGDRLLVHKSYATAGGADHFTFADFDGDATTDIALREPGAAHGDARDPDTIAILFGHLDSVPENPAPLGRLAGVQQIVSGRAGQGLFGLQPDGLGDLGIVSQTADSQQLTVLSGEVDRRIVASFRLNAALAPEPLANRFAAGRFTKQAFADPHDDIAILSNAFSEQNKENLRSRSSEYALWLAPVVGEGSLDPSRIATEPLDVGAIKLLNGALDGDAFFPFSDTLALDLDPHTADPAAEVDEVLVLAQGLGSIPWKLGTFGAEGVRPSAVGVALPAFMRREARDVGAAPSKPTPAFRMFAADLDPKDPKEDADDVVLFLHEGDKSTLRTFFNHRTGKLDPTPVDIALPAGHEFMDVAPIHAGGGAARELALLATDGVYLARVTPSGVTVDPGRVITIEGDVNGDRIDDIILVSDKGIQVFRGEARLK